MRQHQVAGEKVFVDFAGDTLPIYDSDGTILFAAQIFVAALGASNLTYVEVLTSQNLYHVIGTHSRAFTFFGGVPRTVVCDNMKTAVTKADRYEPAPNATYLEMATRYQMTVLPTRPYRPRDKPKVEVAVLVVERWILARLRNR
jgi:transposase